MVTLPTPEIREPVDDVFAGAAGFVGCAQLVSAATATTIENEERDRFIDLLASFDFIDLGMKPVQQTVHERREQHRNNPNERETGKERIKRSEELRGRSRQRIDRPHAGQNHGSVEQ
jgi:hypothetical protein